MRFRRVRITVRLLIVFVFVVACVLGWFVDRARVQRNAVATIRAEGGKVTYAAPGNGREWPRYPRRVLREWARKHFGRDFIDNVTHVDLAQQTCADPAVLAASRLPRLEFLRVVDAGVTDRGATELGRSKNLRCIDLRFNRMTSQSLRPIGEITKLCQLYLTMDQSPVPCRDEDLAALGNLTKLQNLLLSGKTLTDGWLVSIENLHDLRTLELYDMSITTRGLARLRGLTNLRLLTLQGTRITSLEPLRPLSGLSGLCIADTPIDDSALPFLENWPKLGYLDLRKTNITDTGLKVLAELPALRELDLSETKITNAGLAHLAKSASLREVRVRATGVTEAALLRFAKSNSTMKVSAAPVGPDRAGMAGHARAMAGRVKNQAR